MTEHALFAFPAKYGRLAIPDPVSTASTAFSLSFAATATLQHGISTGDDISVHDDHQKCREVASEASRARDERASLISQEIVASLPTLAQRILSRVIKGSASGWLTILPL